MRGKPQGADSVQEKLRQVLRGTDGLTIRELTEKVGSRENYVSTTLHKMVDAYIDRWELEIKAWNQQKVYRGVWCVVEVPENCPHPRSGA